MKPSASEYIEIESFGQGVQFKNPVSDHTVKIYVLGEKLFRVIFVPEEGLQLDKTWLTAPGMEDIPAAGRERLDVSSFAKTAFTVKDNNENFSIETTGLKAVVSKNNGLFSWYEYSRKTQEWTMLAKDRNTQAYNWDRKLGSGIQHYMERSPNEAFYGFGEKTGMLNKKGEKLQMRNLDAMGYDPLKTDPLYKHVPFFMVKNPDHVYGMFYDNTSTCSFDMGKELDQYHGLFRSFQAEGGELDYYFIGGEALSDITKTFSWLTGKTFFGPKWSLGYSGSTMTYTDADNAQEQLQQFLDDCRRYDIPCDSFQLSSGYTSIGDKRYVFNWNKEKFPDPQKLVESFKEAGIRFSANIKPAMLIDHPKYQEAKEKELFLKNKETNEEEIVQFWDEKGAYLDFTNPSTQQWWKSQVTEQLLSIGITSTWNDNNEFEAWHPSVIAHGFGNPLPLSLIRPVQPLLMMKASFEAQSEYHPGERPYVISRSGAPGMQRYAQTWTGDNYTSWESLKYNLRTGLGLSISGIYNIGHDVGGFAGQAPSRELFLRWIQQGIFHPRFTIHSWNEDKSVNVPWMYPDIIESVRFLMKERVRFIPYLYSLLYLASEKYEPLIKPTFFSFENDENTFKDTDSYMLGNDLLVYPVTEEGARSIKCYLPENDAGWYHFYTGEYYSPGSYEEPAPLDQPILFAQAGSVIPRNEGKITFDKMEENRTLHCFPAKKEQESTAVLFEDDGHSTSYKTESGHCKWKITMKSSDKEIQVTTGAEGEFPLPYRTITFAFPVGEKRKIFINDSLAEGPVVTLKEEELC
ncbi:glycoside hydrolase family 31 protein [Alkalicoccus halolimnae]|uniref:Glycoside hydrolase family 31 protein n=1 Tax=Alkalicoccus halolimnae TaxID=1667239 RepID=A0A5C7FGT2_9BACI|nr:glycoside hydrolase family 31 protein [Alkalicoccus halolimnae]TXF85484.1 glycoside hydrolase family 31 protein [Alkalicoccus halolimnae]